MTATVGEAESERLGRYVLEGHLGDGGMADVFRGRAMGAEGFTRAVAIKRIRADVRRDPTFAEMFIAEAKILAGLQHPNIVSVLDFDRDAGGRLYLVMELVGGQDLGCLLASGPLPYSTTIYVIAELLRGLGYAHNLPARADGVRGIVHRDVSPQNVLLSWNGEVKLSDFGIAKVRTAAAATASIVVKGKPAYLSPEQISGLPLDGRSDLFSVGVVLWQMLTGEHLFAMGTTTETVARVLYGPVPSPRALRSEVPRDLDVVAMRLLARAPERRFASAEEALGELLRCHHAPRDGRGELEKVLRARFPPGLPSTPPIDQSPLAACSTTARGIQGPRYGTVPVDRTMARSPTPPWSATSGRSRSPRSGRIGIVAIVVLLATALIGVVVWLRPGG